MKWSLIKSWAKDKGYKVSREKSGIEGNPYNYKWIQSSIDIVGIPVNGLGEGTTNSLSKLAKDIYNHMTDNKFVEHQKQYQEQLSQQDISHETEFGI